MSNQRVKINKVELQKAHEETHAAIARECARISHKPQNLQELVDYHLLSVDAETQAYLQKRGIVGFTNEVPGDQGTKIVEVKAFTPEQVNTQWTVAALEKVIEEGRAAQKLLQELRANCNHFVFADSAGFPYDNRTCRICREYMGTV